jgi:hypothetical protein
MRAGTNKPPDDSTANRGHISGDRREIREVLVSLVQVSLTSIAHGVLTEDISR